jgi:hypothetical protein
MFEQITWDGQEKSAILTMPPISLGSALIAIHNQTSSELTATFEQKIRLDKANATTTIGEGTNGAVTVTVDEPGPNGDKCTIEVIEAAGISEPTDLKIDLHERIDLREIVKHIVVRLAMKAGSDTLIPDDEKNTATLIATAINDLEGFTATASGDGSGVITDTGGVVHFAGGTTPAWASFYDIDDARVSIKIPVKTHRAYGPFPYFPRFLGGRITLASGDGANAPEAEELTIVQVQEIVGR